jgi:hypothetical protein
VNWDAVGAVAELLGGVATVATLAYLAVQIRQATAATRAEIRQSIADSQIHYLNARAIDPFLRRATQKALSGSELDEEERFGLRVHLVAHLRLFENHYSQYRLGTMGEGDWRAQRQLLKGLLLRIEAYRQAYSSLTDMLGDVWNSDFAAEVERILAEIPDAAV